MRPDGTGIRPKGPYLGYHKELPAAERAVEAARTAGKDENANEFKAAEKLMNDAYETYWACRTKEAIAMAMMRLAGQCLVPAEAAAPAAAPAPKPGPPPSPLGQPGHDPAWEVHDADVVLDECHRRAIDNGVGAVPPSGSKEVCPKTTIGYGITMKGPGDPRPTQRSSW